MPGTSRFGGRRPAGPTDQARTRSKNDMRGELLLRPAIAALTGLTLVAFRAGPGILGLGGAGLHWWNNLAWIGASALAMAACLRTGSRRDHQSRAAWLGFGLACGRWLTGSLVWAAYD